MVKTVFASIIAVAATIFLSIGAAAGATVQHFNLNTPEQCFYKLDYKYCVVSAGEETAVQTASGNFSAAVNASDSWVFSQNATILASGTDSIQEHVLYANDFTILKEGGIHQTSTFFDGTTTCTAGMDIHATGLNLYTGTGHFQYTNFTFVCV
ncbi:MAG: hypothetical protein E6I13_02875 [Chloroflexi bacterium]|nr:MAG: hypothetical protein E6I13_02875 [Chloroflexota bacterium]